ncbi:FAD binding domain-containing protein [Cladophialophora immunda]|nr:FAD binding domain-containing protein [Cladophialophora immunda]
MGSIDISSTTDHVVSELVREYPQQIFTPGQPSYLASQQSYWSEILKEIAPRCFFQPRSAAEVAHAVSLCVKAQCPFGVRSGGHAHVSGASCVPDGVQIDLSKLNTITIDRSNSTARVGAGNTWRRIYGELEKQGYIAVGGRSADVGIGGFLVGGGISFFAAEHGWGIDNVRAFEIVLGRTLVDPNCAQEAIEAYADFVPRLDVDPKGHTIVIFDTNGEEVIIRQYLVYSHPKPNLPMYHGLLKVPTLESPLGLTDYSALAADIADLQGGHGLRHNCSTLTIKLDVGLMRYTYDLYVEASRAAKGWAYGCLEFHAIPRSPKPEENMYNLKREDGHLISIMLAFSTAESQYDQAVLDMQSTILGKIKDEATRRALYHPFLFANYAGTFQDVVGSYGESSVKYLSKMVDKYDPGRVFQQLKPGGFKVDAALRHRPALGSEKSVGQEQAPKL